MALEWQFLKDTLPSVDTLSFSVNVYALIVSVVGVVLSTRKLKHAWRTRHLRRVWGIRNRERVILVCSELDDAEARQHVEPREFIYSLKYGDVDAYIEVLVTLLRLFPDIKMRVMSAGEAQTTRLDLTRHLVVIGGPDYNSLAMRLIASNKSQYEYRSPYDAVCSQSTPDEIVLFDKTRRREYCHRTDAKDYGYFERIPNPHNPDSQIILIGGCHTIGVTGAVKAFSMAESEEGDIPAAVLKNAYLVSKRIRKAARFSVLIETERIGQTIPVPVIHEKDITVVQN